MPTNIELRQQRANLWEQAKALLEKAEGENRDFSAEEQEQWDRMHAEMDKLKVRIERAEQLDATRGELDQSLNESHRPDPRPDGGAQENKEVRAAWKRFLRGGPGALSSQEMRALQADADTLGGFLVAPQQFSTQLIKAMDNLVFMRRIANVLPTMEKAESLGVPSLETDMGDPTWTAELAIGSEDTSMAFGKRELSPHPLARYIKVSNKLLRAATLDVETLVRDRLAYKFATVQENAFLNGSGAGQPLGVMVASNDGIDTSRDVSEDNTTTAFTADGLMNCLFKLKPQYRTRASWLFHTDAVKLLSKLKQGDGAYLWSPGLKAGTPDTLINRPLYESAYMPNTFTTGLYVGILGDFSFYWIVDALTLQVQVLKELYAATNQTGYIGRMESDGMPVLAEAFARVKLA